MKILTIVGARPQFIKAAMVSQAVRCHNKNGLEPLILEDIVHTGQHFDPAMSSVFFEELQIPSPKINLNINNASHGEMTARMLSALEKEMVNRKPDRVLVYGDTNSTLAASLAASKLGLPIVHVEAGLRSYKRAMPEEINRIVTDQLSDILLCPTARSVNNLRCEGFKNIVNDGKICSMFQIDSEFETVLKNRTNSPQPGVVINVGDVMYDAAVKFGEISRRRSDILEKLQISEGNFALATVHRAENTDDKHRLSEIVFGLSKITKRMPVVFPIHPRTRFQLEKILSEGDLSDLQKKITCIKPVPFIDMIRLEQAAKIILTDSGGVQKEAFFHGTPCITLRDETEWSETVDSRWNQLVGADQNKIFEATENAKPGDQMNAYGDGHAADRIISSIK